MAVETKIQIAFLVLRVGRILPARNHWWPPTGDLVLSPAILFEPHVLLNQVIEFFTGARVAKDSLSSLDFVQHSHKAIQEQDEARGDVETKDSVGLASELHSHHIAHCLDLFDRAGPGHTVLCIN